MCKGTGLGGETLPTCIKAYLPKSSLKKNCLLHESRYASFTLCNITVSFSRSGEETSYYYQEPLPPLLYW